jgi:hypothetical protein
MKVREIPGHAAGDGYFHFRQGMSPSVMLKSAVCCAFSSAQSFTQSSKLPTTLPAKDADDVCHFILYRAMMAKCPIVFYLTEHQQPFYDFFMKCPYVTAKVTTPTKMTPAGSYDVTMFVVEVPEGSDKEVVQKQENQIGQGAKSWGTRYPSSFKVGV